MNQFRKPSGLFGRFNLANMNRHHSQLTDWGLARVSVAKDATVLDVGCFDRGWMCATGRKPA